MSGRLGWLPVRLRPADPAAVAAPSAASGPAPPSRADLRLLTKHLLALLVAKAPGGAVEVRVPPFAVAQCVEGTRHTRGTPPAVVETDPPPGWRWPSATCPGPRPRATPGLVRASGERSDLTPLLPLA